MASLPPVRIFPVSRCLSLWIDYLQKKCENLEVYFCKVKFDSVRALMVWRRRRTSMQVMPKTTASSMMSEITHSITVNEIVPAKGKSLVFHSIRSHSRCLGPCKRNNCLEHRVLCIEVWRKFSWQKSFLEATKNRAQVVALPNFITIRVFFTGGNTPLLAVISGLAVFRGRADGVLFPLQVRDKYKWFHEHTEIN